MVLGVLVGGRHYALKKYMFVLIIVAGVALFMYNPNKAATAGDTAGGLGIGELMLVSKMNNQLILIIVSFYLEYIHFFLNLVDEFDNGRTDRSGTGTHERRIQLKTKFSSYDEND